MALDPLSVGFTVALQAAGLVGGYQNSRWNAELTQRAGDLEQQQTKMNLTAIKNQSAQASLDAMVDLRKNLSYQVATQSARGTELQGSALSLLFQSEANFNKDEQTRQMNTLAKEADLRAAGVISGMHTFQAKSKIKSDFFNSAIKMAAADANAFALEK